MHKDKINKSVKDLIPKWNGVTFNQNDSIISGTSSENDNWNSDYGEHSLEKTYSYLFNSKVSSHMIAEGGKNQVKTIHIDDVDSKYEESSIGARSDDS